MVCTQLAVLNTVVVLVDVVIMYSVSLNMKGSTQGFKYAQHRVLCVFFRALDAIVHK